MPVLLVMVPTGHWLHEVSPGVEEKRPSRMGMGMAMAMGMGIGVGMAMATMISD